MTPITAFHSAHRGPTFYGVVAALSLAVAAAVLYGVVRQMVDPRPAYIHVRWADDLDQTAREELERRFALVAPEHRDANTYGYFLNDVSRRNVRALVTDVAVADTDGVDRRSFDIAAGAERAPIPDRTARWRRIAQIGSRVFSIAALLMVAIVVLQTWAPAAVETALVRSGRATNAIAVWLLSGVPDATPHAVALFRIAFGVATLVLLVVGAPVSPGWVDAAMSQHAQANSGAAAATFGVFPSLARWITPWLSITGGLFVAGAATRVAYPLYVLGAFGWGLATSLRYGSHPTAVLLVALLCLLPSRWGDAWSVDSWIRRRRRTAVSEPPSPKVYGYTLWVPRVVLGVMFAAAAVAKLRNSGLAWILNGTVKYHFLTDASRAPVAWGLTIGRHPALAVLLSFGAVFVEALILPLAMASPTLAAVAILTLLIGFWLFQGLFWPAWWMLLLPFLPWRRMVAGPMVPSGGRHADRPPLPTIIQRSSIVGMVVLQIAVSTYKIEWPPLLSTYDMYSTTYASPEAYEAATTTERSLVAVLADGTLRRCPIDSDQAAPFVAPVTSDDERERQASVIARCFGTAAVRSVFVEASREQIDWTAWRPLGRATVRVSTLITPGVATSAN